MLLYQCATANRLRFEHPEQLAEHRADCSICLADTILVMEAMTGSRRYGNLDEWMYGDRPLMDTVRELAAGHALEPGRLVRRVGQPIEIELPQVVKEDANV
jgi:hypothetical protein